ncbi:hypothetical protein KKC63_00885 [Patescibacteria group bacterium]|nr:hypothetical protein [Patescibacteria group bacterium]MBU4023416.1 hypothetical protein [Patescibacteria group bacterium]MBU4078003.1 hypothetical protein [Patescibacteria group bacterium]
MLQSKLFYKTKKLAPKEATAISHKLLYRGDFIDQLGSGIYSFLPLGWMVHQNISNIIRQEMSALGGQEVFLPAMHPRSVWQKSDRWDKMKPPLFKLKDSHKKDFALGSTHEEVISQLASSRVASYKDLPFALFQIQSKFRNEIRYTGGLLRTREFIMKDLYSFHADQADFEKYYEKVAKAYFKIFKRCGLKVLRVKASGEGFTNDFTDEFQAITPIGEDSIIYCEKCGFAKNKEIFEYNDGDKCPECKSLLKKERGIEVGNIFPLGDKYSKSFDLKFKDELGKEKFVIMASYGIGVGRLISTIVEVHNDDKGIIWPKEVAPFLVHIVPVEINDNKVEKTAKKLYDNGQEKIKRVIYDDRRNVSTGEKFAESDLLGIPFKIIISKKTLEKDSVEIEQRDGKKSQLIKIKDAMNFNFYV